MTFILALLFTATLGYQNNFHQEYRESISKCVSEQIDLYGDLCAESSTGYQDMDGSEAHYEGVLCGVESIQMCMEAL